VLHVLVALVGLAALPVILFAAGSVGRWLTVRALGVRGVPFPFGAGKRWSWTTTSFGPQALGFLGNVAAMYAVSGVLVAIGTGSAGLDVPDEASMRVNVEAGGPAAAAGIQDGDQVDAVNGESVTSWDALRGAVRAHPLGRVDVTVRRDGRESHLLVTPDRSGLVRLQVPVQHREATVGECLRLGVAMPAMFLYANARGVLVSLVGASHEQVAGPVAIVRETSRQSEHGNLVAFLGLMAAFMFVPLAIAALFTGPGRRRRTNRTSKEQPQ
jgi:membrane-associated protease RseP (regulator of RpoE activity)